MNLGYKHKLYVLSLPFVDFRFNIKYRFQEFGQKNLLDEACIWMLGKKYTTATEFEKDFESIVWCSYRRNFPRLVGKNPPEEVGTFTNDAGWGCMIRVTQMMLAEVLQRKLRKNFESTFHLLKAIISWMVDGEGAESGAPYSIQTICDELYSRDRIKPGSWFKASEIMLTLQRIHQMHCKSTVNSLAMVVFLEGTVYLDQILNHAGIELLEEQFIDVGAENLPTKESEEVKTQASKEKKARSGAALSDLSFDNTEKDLRKKVDFVNVSFDGNMSKDFKEYDEE